MSDWAKILIIRRFHRARRFAARAKSNFQLLTHHYIARATLVMKVTNVYMHEIVDTRAQLILYWTEHAQNGFCWETAPSQ